MQQRILYILIASVFLLDCKPKDPVNPYDEMPQVIQTDNPSANDLPVGNFAWLHAKMFKPTCANSGCHDGTFEPHFSTISASYNSLVNHDVISNDANFSFNYRVVPGNVDESLLHERLTNFIPNSSGIMPLEVDENSDWEDLGDSYIQKLEEWIQAGAPDMYGNMPGGAGADFPPQAEGLVIFPAGNTTDPYVRDEDEVGITPIVVDAASVDIWIRFTDDQTDVQTLSPADLKIAESPEGFATALSYPLSTGSSIMAEDFSETPASFYHRATIDLSGFESGTTFFIRTYVNDGNQPEDIEIPNDNSNDIITSIFVIKIS